jgi:type II secretory pathway pseudopilin PulG
MVDTPEDSLLGSDLNPIEPDRDPSLNWGRVLLVLAAIVGCLAFTLTPNYLRARARGQLTACKSNLKNLATACEMYASDHKVHYPASLELLTKGPQPYLRSIPTCPGAGKVSYEYTSAADPDSFSMVCQGSHHDRAYGAFGGGVNFPQYTATEGLVDHP